jgi:hypothetical protein
MSGVEVTLSGGDLPSPLSTGTDLSGLYQFGDLSAGIYTVTFTVPAGFGLSTPGVLSVTLTQQSPSAEADAGLIPPPASIGNLVLATTLIPVNANDDNGSPIKPGTNGIPTVRDFNATDLPKNDPQLIASTLSIQTFVPGTLTYEEYEPGEAEANYWKDPRKAAPFGVYQILGGVGPRRISFYTEGVHASSTGEDYAYVTFTFTPADPKMAAVSKKFAILVGPIVSNAGTSVPTPSVAFTKSGAAPRRLGGLDGSEASCQRGRPSHSRDRILRGRTDRGLDNQVPSGHSLDPKRRERQPGRCRVCRRLGYYQQKYCP